jgi:hypothetical protein
MVETRQARILVDCSLFKAASHLRACAMLEAILIGKIGVYQQ